MAKRVKHAVEPVLRIHRYVIVTWHKLKCARFRYAMNRQEVRELLKKQPSGTYAEVFKANHDFKEAWKI